MQPTNNLPSTLPDSLDLAINSNLVDFENALMDLTDKVKESKYKVQVLNENISSAAQLVVLALLVGGSTYTLVKLFQKARALRAH